jgi:hypothetical protein
MNLKAFYQNDLTTENAEEVLIEVVKSGVREVWVTPIEMLTITSFVRKNVSEKYNTDELFIRGEVKEVFGIKLAKNYEEKKEQKPEKQNEAR